MSQDVVRFLWRMNYTGHLAHIQRMRNAYKILVGKPEGKRPRRRLRRRWEGNFRMDPREIS
jgi:hypothetical protein